MLPSVRTSDSPTIYLEWRIEERTNKKNEDMCDKSEGQNEWTDDWRWSNVGNFSNDWRNALIGEDMISLDGSGCSWRQWVKREKNKFHAQWGSDFKLLPRHKETKFVAFYFSGFEVCINVQKFYDWTTISRYTVRMYSTSREISYHRKMTRIITFLSLPHLIPLLFQHYHFRIPKTTVSALPTH